MRLVYICLITRLSNKIVSLWSHCSVGGYPLEVLFNGSSIGTVNSQGPGVAESSSTTQHGLSMMKELTP